MGININNMGRELNSYISKQMNRGFFPWGLYFAEVFTEKGGFDIVLGNPPYIGEKKHKEIFETVKHANLREFYLGKMDYFYFFFHLALELSRQNGHIAFITTNYYPTATGAFKLRKDIHDRATINKLVNFNELKIFESATGQHNMITLLSKGKREHEDAATCITDRKSNASSEILTQIISWQDDQTQYFSIGQNELYDDEDFQIRFRGLGGVVRNELQAILYKIKNEGVQLGTLCKINQGIVTGADKVSNSHRQKYQIDEPIGTGIFVLSLMELSKLRLHQEGLGLVRPWYKNSDVNRWNTSIQSNERILYLDRVANPQPGILNYLQKFRDVLNQRREVENGVIEWWRLQWPRSEEIFTCEKIVAPQRSHRNTFGYNEIPWYASADVYFITQNDRSINLKYVLALLNSNIYYLWLYHRGKRKGETLELYQTPLSQVPIPKIPVKDQNSFITAVDEILQLVYSSDFSSNKSKQEKVATIEKSINLLVYVLLNLSDEEIEFVEGFKN